jgi:hypothetical protein
MREHTDLLYAGCVYNNVTLNGDMLHVLNIQIKTPNPTALPCHQLAAVLHAGPCRWYLAAALDIVRSASS